MGPTTSPRPVIWKSWLAPASNAKTRFPAVPFANASPVHRKANRVVPGEKVGNVQLPKGFAVVYCTTVGELPASMGAA